MRVVDTSEARRIVAETATARDHAKALLDRLIEAKADADRRQAEDRREDAYKVVTGRSAMENAIASTRRMIESLDQAVAAASVATRSVCR